MQYGKRTLIGNWYEEKLFPQNGRSQSMNKTMRQVDNDITCYEDKGFQRTLPRLNRQQKGISTAFPNDGYNITKSQMKLDFAYGQQAKQQAEMKKLSNKVSDSLQGTEKNPHHQNKSNIKKYSMLTLQNLYELNVDRQVLMEKTDFRSTFRVEKQNPLEYKTTYDASFSNGQKDVFRETKSLMKTKQSSAGAYDQFKNDSIGLITTLYCEQNRNDTDPKHNTAVQRSWIPSQDLSLQHGSGKTANEFAFRSSQPNDIQTSTNVNAGMHSIHPKEVSTAFYRHVRQDVTLQPNKTPSTR